LECVNLPIPAVYNQEEYTINGNSELVEHDFIVFYHGRQLWASNPDNLSDFAVHGGNKRNDKVIRAFARFVRKTSFKSPVLIMFEYGPDVDASKELIEEEGIANNVLWRPISTRKEIMRELSQADIATEYFRPNGCGLGGTGLEAMACGVPLLTHTNGASIDPGHHLYNIPIVDVLEAEEIYSTFVDYEKNPGKYRELGDAAREWYDRKHGKGSISRYMNLFNKIIADRDNTLSKES
jgi:glycosyltransferase involved in cell wall biosynthesis